MFLHLEQIWIPGHHKGRTTLYGCGNVFVIIGILTHPMESKLAGNEIAEDDNRLEPRHRVDIRANAFSHLRVPERPENFFDDGWRQDDLKGRVAEEPFEDVTGCPFRTDNGTDGHVGIKNGSKHRSFHLARGLLPAATRPLLSLVSDSDVQSQPARRDGSCRALARAGGHT